MTVSTRNTFLAAAGGLALIALGGVAYAGGGDGGKSPCCGKGPKGHGVVVPGVHVAGPNVMVSGPKVVVNQGSVISKSQTFLSTSVVGSQQGVIVSGGGGYFSVPGVAPTTIGALNVEGNVETYLETITEEVATTEEYCEETVSMSRAMRAVQAVCIDDKGAPHPASQVIGEKKISGTYGGEVFRCMAGTHMQVTLGSVDKGHSSFAHGETFSCRKGEALVHKAGGHLACSPQKPQRSCNERSLLRRHGPGIKLIESTVKAKTCIPKTRTVMRPVQRQVERVRQVKGQPMVFDGGVGQGVN